MLNDADRSRIRSEEIFRLSVIRELEATRPGPSPSRRLWLLLNSSFALWFLSSVVLAGLTGWFASYQSKRNEQLKKADTVRRLDTEIGNRISEALAGLTVDEQRIRQHPSFTPMSIYANVVLYLDNSFISNPSNPRDFSIYPDYRNRTFRSMILELNSLIDPSGRPELKDALDGYEKLADLGSIGETAGKGTDRQAELVAAVAKSRELLTGRILKDRWRSYMQP
jgi:hypothetical protein